MIDVHTHFMLPEHWGGEHDRYWRGAYDQGWPLITPQAFDAAMAEGGVELAVVFGITGRDSGVQTPTAAVREFISRLTTPAVGFMALDPSAPGWREELDEGLAAGMVGVKLYPVLAHFDATEPRFDAFYEALVEHALPVLWHMGATPSSPGRLTHSHPLVIDEVATRHPALRQVIAHLGHPWQRDAVQVVRTNRNVYADVSGIWARPMDGLLAILNAQEWGVVDKLLVGSDYPLWTPREATEGLRRLEGMSVGTGLPQVATETIDAILASDPLAMLGIARPEMGAAAL
jgi:predicted TIM-barrel fold metal-dependent hydrolase